MVDLHNFFRPKRIAVIGVSRNMNKVGHVIFKNLIDGNFPGEVFPVNKNAESLFNRICYKSVRQVPGKVDLAVIAVPAESVLEVVLECAEKILEHEHLEDLNPDENAEPIAYKPFEFHPNSPNDRAQDLQNNYESIWDPPISGPILFYRKIRTTDLCSASQ